MTALFSVLLVVLLFLPFVFAFIHRLEVKNMTMEKFKQKFADYVRRKDGDGAVAFVKRNFAFVLLHRKAISEWVRATYPDSNILN